jgi:hypothetical protein
VDFEDDRFGGYSIADYEHLIRECRFLDMVESPGVLFRHGHSDQATAHNSLPDVVPLESNKREAKANV